MSQLITFTSESVSEGHPDKVADQISDAILDEALRQDPLSRVACETLVKDNNVVIAGEITTTATLDYDKIARDVVRSIGYNDPALGFDADSLSVTILVGEQSPDIAQGVNEGEGIDLDQGAGDQGLMFGYACKETPELMPAPVSWSHKLVHKLAELRKGGVSWLKPDAKSQVSVVYDDSGRVSHVDAIVISTQHDESVTHAEIVDFVITNVINEVIPAEFLTATTKFHINPTGQFIIGGPVGDAGVTGRKIIVDTYGGKGRHGGGAFSGKDPSKVDRSAAYAARWVAKNVVAAGLAETCEVQISYAIGVADPVSIFVNTFGSSTLEEREIEDAVIQVFDLRPKAITQQLDLLRPIYLPTAAYGHFGRPELDLPWEATNKVDELRRVLDVE